jgi:hypothetical protein
MMRVLALAALLLPTPAAAQQTDPAAMAAQKAALAPLAVLDGQWRGEAVTSGPMGEHRVTHTERVGSLLDGAVKVIEGHAYNADGSTGFNALGVISFDAGAKSFAFRTYAQGHAGTFPMTITPGGYVWETPAGPGATMRYTATFTATTWREVGERVVAGQQPQRIFEMNLKKIGSSDWPSRGAVPMK